MGFDRKMGKSVGNNVGRPNILLHRFKRKEEEQEGRI